MLIDLRAVGIYSVAYGVAEVLLLIPQRLGTLYLPRVAAQLGSSKEREVQVLSSTIFWGTALAAAPADHAGIASGVNNAIARIAGLLGIAVVGAAIAGSDNRLDLNGFRTAMAITTVTAIAIVRRLESGSSATGVGWIRPPMSVDCTLDGVMRSVEEKLLTAKNAKKSREDR